VTSRTLVMGVVNVTPDSFSDGGQWFETDVAIAHGRTLLDQGADIIDVGGESTRPGAERISEAEELQRVMPVARAMIDTGVPVSVDTMRAAVAETALDAGVSIINDVYGGMADPGLAAAVAGRDCRYIVSHWRGHSDVMNARAVYTDVTAQVRTELAERVSELLDGGLRPQQVVIDPGLGFAKNAPHNWRLLADLQELMHMGYPVLIGASRKRFLGQLLAEAGAESSPGFRDRATAAVSALAAAQGVWAVRVHDVAGSVDAIRVAQAWREAEDER